MIVARTLYLIAPLLLAGIVQAVVIRRNLLAWLAHPLDGRRTFRGKRLLGDSKTWRGLVGMTVVTVLAVLGQHELYALHAFRLLSLVDYSVTPGWIELGLALGLGYSLAELPNSFVKRRLGIAPGRSSARGRLVQYLADQGDSALGGTLALAIFLRGDLRALALVFALGLLLHALFDRGLYATGVKRR